MKMYSIKQCYFILDSIRAGGKFAKFFDLIKSFGYEGFYISRHVADRLYDHNIELQDFYSEFLSLFNEYIFTICVLVKNKPSGVRIKTKNFVLVFSEGAIDKKLVFNTMYPLRNFKTVEFSTGEGKSLLERFKNAA